MPPSLTIENVACNATLTTYTVDFSSNATITSDVGTVVGNQIMDIPLGTDVNITATSSGNCVATETVTTPNCCPAKACVPFVIRKNE